MDVKIIIGLVVGGLLAAPFSAYMTSRLPAPLLLLVVGGALVGIGVRNLLI